jgi:hypothetical protein
MNKKNSIRNHLLGILVSIFLIELFLHVLCFGISNRPGAKNVYYIPYVEYLYNRGEQKNGANKNFSAVANRYRHAQQIWFFGGSTCEMGPHIVSTNETDSIPNIFSRICSQGNEKFTIYNFGQSGYTVNHSRVLFLELLRKQRPDTVVFYHGANEPRTFPEFNAEFAALFDQEPTKKVFIRTLLLKKVKIFYVINYGMRALFTMDNDSRLEKMLGPLYHKRSNYHSDSVYTCLTDPGFYDVLAKKYSRLPIMNEQIKDLLKATASFRGQDYQTLSPVQKRLIGYLNLSLLKRVLPNNFPTDAQFTLPYNINPFGSLSDREELNDLIYNIEILHTICKSKGIKFLFIFQPTLFSKRILSPQELSYMKSIESYRAGKSHFIETVRNSQMLCSKKYFYDISGLFEHTNRTIFNDYCHTADNEPGNYMIAKKIFSIVFNNE